MTAEQIAELAKQISSGMVWAQWPTYLLIALIAFVLFYFNRRLASYASKTGEIAAITGQFEALTKQLKANTHTVEIVKAEIAHGDWATREWKTLRRLKLEELLQAMLEQNNWSDVYGSELIFGDSIKAGPPPVNNVELIGLLYFPELDNEIFAYCQAHQKLKILTLDYSAKIGGEISKTAIAKLHDDVGAFTNALDAKKILVEEYIRLSKEDYKLVLMAEIAIKKVCRDLLMKIVSLKSEPS